MEAEEEQIREFNLISAELIQRNSQEGLESELPPIPPEELEVTAEQDSPDARPQSTKTVAFTVGEAEKKKPANDRTKKMWLFMRPKGVSGAGSRQAKLWRARSRRYRGRFSQVRTRLKALAAFSIQKTFLRKCLAAY